MALLVSTLRLALTSAMLGVALWAQVTTQILPTNYPLLDGEFGRAVALDGDVLAIGSNELGSVFVERGRIQVFDLSPSGQWVPGQELRRAPHFIYGAGRFGSSITIVGDSMMVGMRGGGVCWEYRRINGLWTGQEEILPSVAGQIVGAISAIAYDGTTLVTGLPQSSSSGSVIFWERGASAWEPMAYVVAAEVGIADQFARFGSAVAVRGDLAVVGAESADIAGIQDAGAAVVFRRVNGVWQHDVTISRPGGPTTSHVFGASLEIGADDLFFAACDDDIGELTSIYVMRYEPSIGWQVESRLYPTAATTGPATGSGFGRRLRFRAGSLAVMAPGYYLPSSHPGSLFGGLGTVLVYERCGDLWNQTIGLTAPYEFGGNNLGLFQPAMDFDGQRIVAGAAYYSQTSHHQGVAAVVDYHPSSPTHCLEIGRVACVPAALETTDCPCGTLAVPGVGCPNGVGQGARLYLHGGFNQITIRRALVDGTPPGSTVMIAAGRPFPGPPLAGFVLGSGVVCMPLRVTTAMGTSDASGSIVFDEVPGPTPWLPHQSIFYGMSLPYQAIYLTPTPDACGNTWNTSNSVLLYHSVTGGP